MKTMLPMGCYVTRFLFFPFIAIGACIAFGADSKVPPANTANCYMPIEGGWRIHITADPAAPRLKPGEAIGVVGDNPVSDRFKGGPTDYNCGPGPWDDPRTHRRPLYPPSDRSLVWTADEIAKRERVSFRPRVICANEPRFLVDMESAGGHSGHLLLGLSLDGGPSKWLHEFSELDVQYVEGRMEYVVRDAAFPGVIVRLVVLPLADSVGMAMNVQVEGVSQPADLVWVFGGASGYEHYKFTDGPEFRFAPGQCDSNVVRWDHDRCTLSRKGMPLVRCGSSWPNGVGFGDPQKVMESPAAVCVSAQWCSAGEASEEPKQVAIQKIRVEKSPMEGRIVIGRGGRIESFLADPRAAEKAGRARSQSIATRVVAHTPDPYLNQAMPMIALSTDGVWGDTAILHGAWSWHQAYLGWRDWYGSTCYGWTDRVKHSIERHCKWGLIHDGPDKGALSSMLEAPGCGYNMNEVFLDEVRQYFEYTDDVALMRSVFPVLEGIVDRESRRLKPGPAPLYESALDTWISDSHWYIRGQCTTASAYMLGAHQLLAEVTEALGKDSAPYRQKAEAIRTAMQQKLWQPRRGVFAECLDTLGAQLLHPEPELATIYHSAEFGAADPLQIYQMMHWAENNLRSESTPGGGRLCWSSNWAPNAGRSYTHSTYEMAPGEQLNLAIAQCLAGRSDEAYALLRGVLNGIYNGPTPGGLACHITVDGRQRRNAEFCDTLSMWGRAVVEGMFGIRPKRNRGVVELSPQFPADWPEASIKTPHFGYQWKREAGRIRIEWESPVMTTVELRQPLHARRIEQVTADGSPIAYRTEPDVGLTWLITKTPAAQHGTIVLSYEPADITLPKPLTWKEGAVATLNLADYAAVDCFDPQGVLADAHLDHGLLRGTVAGERGARLMFLKAGYGDCAYWLPLTVRVEPKEPALAKVWSAPKVAAGDLKPWSLVDIDALFNASLPEVLEAVGKASQAPPEPASSVNYSYWRTHVDGDYGPAKVANFMPPHPVSDAAWRKKIGPDQIGWTHDGIPLRSPRDGNNIAVVTRAGGFPQQIECPVNASGKELYLMLSGMTYPMQSHVVNLRVTLDYADGEKQSIDLVNPFDIGDCWSTWCGRWHDTAANGFENLGGRFGPPGSAAAGDLSKPIAVDTEAHLVKIPLRHGIEVRSLTLEAVANDVIFGLMGASVLR